MNRLILEAVIIAAAWFAASALLAGETALPNEIHVGRSGDFTRIEDAIAAAAPGCTIVVHPLPDGAPYEQVALMIRKPNLTIEAAAGQGPIKLSGVGFDYSGVGSIPRAIIQFDPDGDNCTFDGFEMFGAANESKNGAGVRINQADNVTIRNCIIYNCEMGIMSNGAGSGDAANQLIDTCVLHDNGSPGDGGYSHNLYLGGFSVRLQNCEVYASVTGHNVKSRAHITEVIDCYIHDSANREIDIVDGGKYTNRDGSDALIKNCRIWKAPALDGNRGVIHFGQDVGGERNGTIRLIDTTIVTPFISPVLTLSSEGACAHIERLTVLGGGVQQSNKTLFAVSNGALLSNVSGFGLSIVEGYTGVTVDGVAGTNITPPVTILPW